MNIALVQCTNRRHRRIFFKYQNLNIFGMEYRDVGLVARGECEYAVLAADSGDFLVRHGTDWKR